MDGDLVSLLIYVALALVGVIASAAKNRAKKQQAANRTGVPQVPRTFRADPADNLDPDLGPLMELFNIPKRETPLVPEYETIEKGTSVEEAGMQVDTQIGSEELAASKLDVPESEIEKGTVESFEEGQSDIQKMIAKYDAIRKQLDEESMEDEIARGEIVSVDAENEATANAESQRGFFDARKAIIYSEILKRREY